MQDKEKYIHLITGNASCDSSVPGPGAGNGSMSIW